MKVTQLKAQPSQPGRYSVYIDGRYMFSLSGDALLQSKLTIGQDIDQARLTDLEQLSAADKAYRNALRFAMMRPRSQWELRTYMDRKRIKPELTEEVMRRIQMQGLLDDLSFARSWVANGRVLQNRSTRRLREELRQKHIDGAIIDQALADDSSDEQTALKELIRRKRHLPRYRQDTLRLMQYLSRQGYNYGDIKNALAGIEREDDSGTKE